MKAVRITAPKQVELCDVPDPQPGPEDVLLGVRYVGLCGSDLKTYLGQNPLIDYPRVPGHEVAAVVEEIGPDVPASLGLTVGQYVTVSPYTACGRCAACKRNRPNACQHNQTLGVQRDGALTEGLAIPWPKVVPAGDIAPRDQALIEPLSVGFHAVDRGRVAVGETVAVIGCGMIGLGAVAAAARRGAVVVAVDIDDDKLLRARKLGAAHAVNSATADLPETLRQIATDGPDVVIEAVGLPATFEAAVDLVAYTGRVVYIGYAKQPVCYETRLFVQKELDILGSRNALDDFPDVIDLLRTGKVPTDELVTFTAPLADTAHALARWADEPAHVTKILIHVGE